MTDKNIVCIYHGDCIDGFTAAWAVWRKFGNQAEYIPARYGDAPPDVTHKDVIIVDFSYKRSVLEEMHRKAEHIIVLDHHKTAEKELYGLDFAHFDMGRSGAGLAWDQYHTFPIARTHRPWLVNYVEDRDLWKFLLPGSKEANAWIGVQKRTSFEDWDRLDSDGLQRAIESGRAVLTALDRYVEEMSAIVQKVTICGSHMPIVNAPYINISELLQKLAEKEAFSVGWYQRADGKFVYSLRSSATSAVDVSDIARIYGGGGHKNSAGFLSELPPWKLF
jgi:oligoribonuclease NrnB/cAMP/cGMP phosphodiesterase (DHH superfamily)